MGAPFPFPAKEPIHEDTSYMWLSGRLAMGWLRLTPASDGVKKRHSSCVCRALLRRR